MPLNVMLNPKKQGCNAYYEPNSGLHVTIRKRHGSVNELNPYIFYALKNGTLVPLNFRVNLETMEVEMIGADNRGQSPLGQSSLAAGASNKPPHPGQIPADNKPYANTDTQAEPKMQISRPAPGQKQTVIEKPPAGQPYADAQAPPASQPQKPAQSDAGQPETRRPKGRPAKANKEE